MGKSRWSGLWRCGSSFMTSEAADDIGPSTSGVSASDPSVSLEKIDLRDSCDQIFAILENIENAGRQQNVEQTLRSKDTAFWPRLSCLPILQELLKQEKPNDSVLGPYFPKGENDTNTLVYMIFRDVPGHLRHAVAILAVGASLENWVSIDQEMKEECLNVLRQMCMLAKQLYELRNPMTKSSKLQQDLLKGEEHLVEGSIMCSIHVHGSHLRRYLKGCSYKETLKWLFRRMKSTHEALCAWSESLIFQGVRSSPLPGRLGINYPHHAVGIERQRQQIIDMLEWNNQRRWVAVIVSGPPGIGKTTLADAVFASIHIPQCNYIRYTEGALNNGPEGFIKEEKWIRYPYSRKSRKVDALWINEDQDENKGEDEEEDDDGNGNRKEEEHYQESEARESENEEEEEEDDGNGNREEEEHYQESEARESENEEEEEDGNNAQSVDKENQGKEAAEDGARRDLNSIEFRAIAAARARREPCSFIYIDDAAWRVHRTLNNIVPLSASSKQRILITTSNMESTWNKCAQVLTEDCIYNYIMMSTTQTQESVLQHVSAEKRPVTTCVGKTQKELEDIAKAAMGETVWRNLQPFPSENEISPSSASSSSGKLLIKMCEGISEWLVLVGKYIAAQKCPRTALQQLLDECAAISSLESDAKWENLIKIMTRDLLTEEEECMDALQVMCRYYDGDPSAAIVADCAQDVLEEHALKSMQDRGLLYLSDDRWRVRLAYPVRRYCISTSMHMHRYVTSGTEKRTLEEQLRVLSRDWGNQTASIPIKVLRLYCEMDTSNLHVLANNLLVLWLPWHSAASLHRLRHASFEKLLRYRGPSTFPLHRASRLKHVVITHLEDCMDLSSHRIPESVRDLHLENISELSSPAMENIARLSNLKSLTLEFQPSSRVEMKIPMEICASNILQLNINCPELYELPRSFGQLRCLQFLRLQCPRLIRLPAGFGMLQSLMELDFIDCKNLKELCTDFSNLVSLRKMQCRETRTFWTMTIALPEECWKQMVKLKRLRVLVLDVQLLREAKRWPFAPLVEMYCDNNFGYEFALH